MKYYAILALAAGSTSAFSADLVSAFDFSGDLNPYVNVGGHAGPLTQLNGGANPTATSSTYSTATVGSVTKQVLNIASGDSLMALHGIAHNGGGAYVNQYTILMDVKFNGESANSYSSLFNTAADNGNDGDSFLQWGGNNTASVGVQGTYGGSVTGDAWHRLAVSVEAFPDGTELTYYSDGVKIGQRIDRPGGQPTDGRFALYSYDDNDTSFDGVYIFGDEDGENASGQISKLAFFNGKLDELAIQKLGGAGQPVPEPSTLAVLGLSCAAILRRRRRA